MFCSKCGYKNDDAAAFCNGCGAALSVVPAQAEVRKPRQDQGPAPKGPKILIVVGIILTALLALSIVTFIFGAFIFEILGEGRYFDDYVVLDGYFPIVNLMFLLDYMMMAVGCVGIPVLIAGIIWKSVANK